MKILRITLALTGMLGLLDTLLLSFVSSLNLGVLLPSLIGAPLLITGIFWRGLAGLTARGPGMIIKYIFIAGYALMALMFAVTWIIIDTHNGAHSAQGVHGAPDGAADAIIVLGAGVRGETPTLVLLYRINAAEAYLKAHPNAVAVVSGGQGPREHISEAEAMARALIARGIAQSRIIKEDKSMSTRENFAFSHALIKERLGEHARIAYVTTDFHVLRAGLVAKKQGIEAAGIPAKDVWYISVNNHLRECVALWGYAVTGEI